MQPSHIPWYRTKWGIVIAVVFSPIWIIYKKVKQHRVLRTALGLIIAVFIFVIFLHIVSSIFSSKSTTQSLDSQGAPSGSATSQPALTGYGATLSQWNSDHTMDSNFTANTVYNPNNSLGNGFHDVYVGVLWISGRALGYQIGFASNTGIGTAKQIVVKEFPSDATILWQKQNNSDPENICYQMEVHSSVLGNVLDNSGDVFIEFQTVTGNDNSNSVGYYQNNVNNALLRNSYYKTAASVGGC